MSQPQSLGKYQIQGLLGKGAMGVVYKGFDPNIARPVAIKTIHASLLDTEMGRELLDRFRNEAQAVGRLNHANIVSIYEFDQDKGTPYFVMEYVEGHDLKTLLKDGRKYSPQEAVHIIGAILSALDYTHKLGIVHRDIKPGNILLSPDGHTVKVADFGIAKTPGSAQTTNGQIIGTMAYMSPERVAGAPASVADDLYAVAVLAYEAVLGRRAFPHDNPAALARAIIDTPPPPLARLRPQLGPALTGVIDRAMARDPRQRFASAEQMRAAAAGDAAALTASVAPAPSATPPGTRPLTTVQPPPGTVAAPSASFFVAPRRRGPATTRTALLAAAGVAVALMVSVLALVLDSASPATSPAEPAGISTPVAPPTPPSPHTAPVVGQPPVVDQPQMPAFTGGGPGKKNENGKGRGTGKGKDDD